MLASKAGALPYMLRAMVPHCPTDRHFALPLKTAGVLHSVDLLVVKLQPVSTAYLHEGCIVEAVAPRPAGSRNSSRIAAAMIRCCHGRVMLLLPPVQCCWPTSIVAQHPVHALQVLPGHPGGNLVRVALHLLIQLRKPHLQSMAAGTPNRG